MMIYNHISAMQNLKIYFHNLLFMLIDLNNECQYFAAGALFMPTYHWNEIREQMNTYAYAIQDLCDQPISDFVPVSVLPVCMQDLQNGLNDLMRKSEKDSTIEYAIYAIAIANNRQDPWKSNVNGALNKICDMLSTDSVHFPELKASLQAVSRLDTVRQDFKEAGTKYAGLKDPPAWYIAFLEEAIVGTLKTVPAIGGVTGVAASLISNLAVKTSSIAVGSTGGQSGIVPLIFAKIKEAREKKLDKSAKNATFLKLPGVPNQGVQAANLFNEANTVKMQDISRRHTAAITSKRSDKAKRAGDAAKVYFDLNASILDYFTDLLPVLVQEVILLSFKRLIDRLQDNLLRTQVKDPGLAQSIQQYINSNTFGKETVCAAAIIYGYYLRSSLKDNKIAPPTQYWPIFESENEIHRIFYVNKPDWKPQKNKVIQEARVKEDPNYGFKHGNNIERNVSESTHIGSVEVQAQKYINKIKESVVGTLNNGIQSGVAPDKVDKMGKFLIMCALIANEFSVQIGTYKAPTAQASFWKKSTEVKGEKIYIQDTWVAELDKLGWVKTYTKTFSVLRDATKTEYTGIGRDTQFNELNLDTYKLRYPTNTSDLTAGNASKKELCMLATFCIYVTQRTNLEAILLGYERWDDYTKHYRKLIIALNQA